MYAVVKTGGKQYRVAKDDVIVVEKLEADAGVTIELDQVLAMDDGKGLTLGTPLVDGARVAATVLDQTKGDKVIIFKKKRRKNYRRTRGHRQLQTVLRVTEILAKGQKASAAAAVPAPVEAREPATDDVPAAKAKGKAKKAAAKGKAKKSAGKAKGKSAPKSDPKSGDDA